MKKNTPERAEEWFWSRLDKQGKLVSNELGHCWEWGGFRINHGYGHVRFMGALELTHRVAWILTHGELSNDVCHKCDNPPCARPDHLFEGTQKENIQDCVLKGRMGKISLKTVAELRAMGPFNQRQMARSMGVNQSCISEILNNKTYRLEDLDGGSYGSKKT